jgi:hypothetical protein
MANLKQECFVKSSISDKEKVPILGNDLNSIQASASEVHRKSPSSELHVVFASLCAAVGSLCFGYSLGYSSPALPDLTTEIDDKIRLSDSQGSFFAVSFFVVYMVDEPERFVHIYANIA